MAINLFPSKDVCCGCRACEYVCSVKAINMVEDKCGFLYPSVNKEACVECGACLKKCAFQSGYPKRREFDPSLAFGARHKREETFMHSRSGGAFVAMSDYVLACGGEVYGAGYDSLEGFFKVVHKRATTKEERDEFCGSKYVQSNLNTVFVDVQTSLKNGVFVLFSGTGCQVGALHLFLGREYDNLFTIDIICHGVPSPKLWADYLKSRERKIGGIVEVDFRDKRKYGWTAHHETIRGTKAETKSRLYTRLFYSEMSRPSCYRCIYCNTNRPGDVTLADFWGHEKAIPGIWDDNKGISLVLVNTKQGRRLWSEASNDLDYVDCTGYPFRHINLRRPTKKPPHYDAFWELYQKEGFSAVAKKYGAPEKKSVDATTNGITPVPTSLNASQKARFSISALWHSLFNKP